MSWLYSQVLVEEYLAANFSDGGQSVQSSGNHIPQAYLSPGKMTDFSRLSRFGMTFKPLTDDLGEELLMSYLEAFRAKTLARLVREKVLEVQEAVCGNIWQESSEKWNQLSFLSKTPLCSALEDSVLSSKTLPRWGTMRNGECYQQPMLVQTTKEKGCGLSPNGVDTFHTPNCTGLDGGSNSRKALKKRLEQFPTPTCHNSKEGAYPAEFTRKTPTLATHAGGKLNPTWVEWLMGWPLGWTDLKPLEMDKSHCVRQLLGQP
jgi:hypothetical protein